MNRNARIAGTGSYAPKRILKNQYFNELLAEDVDTWLVDNLTIRQRHWCDENESTADLAYHAAQKALVAAAVSASDLDLIIVSTDTPEYISPSTAAKLQHMLKAQNAGTFDINTACAGFVTALDVGAKYIRSDEQYNNILVIGAYAMSKYLDLYDKKTVTLFADGAGAVVLQATEDQSGFLGSKLISEGQYHDWMGIYAGGTFQPVNKDIVERKDHLLKFVKKFPKEINPQTWTKMVQELSARIRIPVSQIDKLFFTQININSIRETMDNLSLPFERTHNVMDKYAYTGSACIPMSLDDAVSQNKMNDGDVVFFIGSGGGLAFAAAAFRW